MLRRALIRGAAAGLLLLLALAGLACATAGTQDPGSDPARVRVLVDLKEDRSLFNQFDDTTPYTSWDWGLYLIQGGRNVPLRPDPPQQLKVIRTPRLVRDTVFLAPPGNHTLRLIVHASVGVRDGWTYWPITTVLVDQTFALNLKPGEEMTLRPTQVHSNSRGNLVDPYSAPTERRRDRD